MRLKRLDLTRYGKFTDRTIEFGERRRGAPDLHVIYGPNEAGKSTAFSAYLDLLFGIATQSPYGFLHPYPTMRIGGAVEFADGARDFVRIKRPQNSLLDRDDRPIPEAAIRAELGGVDRDSYRTMFSLDDETLEKGGDSILASKGDLGELLFSAGAGLTDLGHKLPALREEADAFYKFRGRNGALAALKSRLAELKTERARIDTLASDHKALVELRDRAAAHYDEAMAARTRIGARMEEIGRLLAALPRLAALRAVRERLAPLADLPDAPAAWAEDLPALQRREHELAVQLQGAEGDAARLAAGIESVDVDEAALRASEALDRLAGPRARHLTAEKDLPERRLSLRDADLAVARILDRLERRDAEPRRLLLGAATTGRLRELIEARSGLDAALRAAEAELADAQRHAAEAEAKLRAALPDGAGPAAPKRIAALAAVLAGLRGADYGARRRLAGRARDAADAKLAEHLRALAPWRGGADDLPSLPCPDAGAVRRWTADIEKRNSVLSRHATDIERLTTEIGRLRAERAGIEGATGVICDGDAAALRARREQAWAAHRRALDAASADAFEAILRQDDMLAAARLAHMAERAKLHGNGQALAVAEAALARAVELRNAAAASLASLEDEVAAAIRAVSPLLSPSLPDFEAWLGKRDAALAARAALLEAERDLGDVEADARDALHRLKAALAEAGIACGDEAGLEALRTLAQDALDREAEIGALREALERRGREAQARRDALERAQAADAAWRAAWAGACGECWLGEGGDAPAIATMREILVSCAELGPALDKQAGLADRVAKMEHDQAEFAGQVAALAAELGMAGDAPALDAAKRIEGRIHDAIAGRDRRAAMIEALDAAHAKRRALVEEMAVHERRKEAMTALFGVATLDDVARKLGDAAKRNELRDQEEAITAEILAALDLTDIVEAERLLDAADRFALEAELAELKARFADQDQRCHELFAARSQAADRVEAIGGDGKVAEIEERRRTTLLEIEDGAMRYLQLRAGMAAAEQGLRLYRDRHRSSMMARASDAFRTISRGAYAGLAAQPGRDCETLIALAAGGGSKAAVELSKGTRFQLYLALRVAGYGEFVRARAPVPFIADDIMETFDDFRAEEAFRLFAEMAEVGQVIYLTHHRHLCDIARRACPAARIHDLTAPPPPDMRLIA